MSDIQTDERRPIDLVDESIQKSAEAAQFAEHIRDNSPKYTREKQFELLIQLIDESHESALAALVGLDNE